MPLRPGDPLRLGRYELVSRLGQGGMGTVFLGRAADGTLVAIKMVRPEYADDPEFRGRFRSEVSRAQQVPPFSTAAVLDADPEHTPPYLVVEFVDGPSLTELVQQQGPLSGAALQSVAVGMATALTAIHGAGVIHRDLKPGNVLFALGGIKVIDFGIARAFEATSRHTRTDQMVGTVAYMAPERFDPGYGKDVTSAADVFAWGAVVAYAATGRTPFAGDSPAATAMRILTQPPDISAVPEPLRGLVESTLAKYPEQRPTARELLDSLLGSQTQPMRAVPVAVPPPDDTADVPKPTAINWPRRTAVAVAAAALLLIGGLVGAHSLSRVSSDPSGPSRSSAAAQAPPVDARTAILAGARRFSIRLTEADRYFMLDRDGEELEVSDGTGSRSQFVLEPVGVRYLIRSLGNEGFTAPPTCLGISLLPEERAVPVVGTACNPTKGTLFSLTETGEQNAGGSPTYRIGSEYGWLLWDADAKRSEVTEVGEPQFADTYTLVDRGELGEAATKPAPSATPATTDPELVDADLSALKNFAINLGVPVVITTTADAGAEYHLEAHRDGTVDFTGTAVTESTRMILRPAQVRKRTTKTRNHVVIVASPAAAGAGPESCVTDESRGVVRMRPCRPGDTAQSWRLAPVGDSGLFELTGAHTALQVDEGKLVEEGGWTALQTTAVKP
ncbi:serine/threonine protein kinase [Actinoplanes sp. NPDC049599]|uniref:serine/threonine protein kinase n=1 Tax=Actinoplanes sp. NPDC049599 TaxID=3363903 RepID=UPI00378C1C39